MRHPAKVTAFMLFCLFPASCGPAEQVSQRNHQRGPQASEKVARSVGAGVDEPAEFLAHLDGSQDVADYSGRLDRLEKKCDTPDREKLSKDVGSAVQFAREAGHELAAHELLDAMIEGLRSDTSKSISCAEAAQFIVSNTVRPGSVKLTPAP